MSRCRRKKKLTQLNAKQFYSFLTCLTMSRCRRKKKLMQLNAKQFYSTFLSDNPVCTKKAPNIYDSASFCVWMERWLNRDLGKQEQTLFNDLRRGTKGETKKLCFYQNEVKSSFLHTFFEGGFTIYSEGGGKIRILLQGSAREFCIPDTGGRILPKY